MERQYSEADIKVLNEADAALKAAGYDFYTTQGSEKNTNLVMGYLQGNPQVAVTLENIYAFIKANVSHFVFRTAAQQKFDRVAEGSGRTREELETFLSLLSSVGARHRVDTTGENFWTNAAIALQWMQGRPLDAQTLTLAIQNLAPHSQGSKFGSKERLIFVRDSVPVDPRRLIHAADVEKLKSQQDYRPGVLFEKSTVNQNDATRFRGHTEEQPAPQTTQEQKEQSFWSRLHDSWERHGSHGQQQALKEVRAREVAKHNGSERLADKAIQEAYRAIHKTRPEAPTPPEVIAGMARR